MADREKVIASLGTALVQMHGCGRYTPKDVDELETAAWGALKLLEEQEPKQMWLCNGKLCCPQCGTVCKSYYHYCNECGQAVKWDE